MRIRKRIENGFALAPKLYKLRLFQHAKLMRNCRSAEIQKLRNIAYAHFALKQHIEYFYPCAVSKHFIQLRKIVQKFFIRADVLSL